VVQVFDGRFRAGVDRVVVPAGTALGRTKLSPDHLTAFGLLLSIPTALAIGSGHLWVGLALLVGAAVPDLLDGALAKASGRASVRGAFFDSVCDRVTDTFVLGGIAWYLQDRYHGHAAMLPFALLGASLLISYERAKAESLGYNAKGGLMERAERIVALCIGLAFNVVLVPVLCVMLALTLFTAVQRFVKVWRQASAPPKRVVPAKPEPNAVALRWRAWREANGWTPRPDRYRRGSAGSGAAVRWRERRVARLESGREHRRSSSRGSSGRSGTRRP
jgi:CDP-diacylglycerol--glycerol-3-phosphate 3-phosphatidyltransferase